MDPNQKLLSKLCRELFQAETSARLHPRREAKRLGDCGPAVALMAVSKDAEVALATLPAPFSEQMKWTVGSYAGHALSLARQVVIDRVVDRERSYRGTLFGLHHCVDLVTLLRPVAAQCGEAALVEWCRLYLERRRPLVARAVEQLEWFAQHSDIAIESGLHPGPA